MAPMTKESSIKGVGSHSIRFQPVSPLPWLMRDEVEYFELLSRVRHPGGWMWEMEELFSCPKRSLAVDLSMLRHAAFAAAQWPNYRFAVNVAPESLVEPEYLEMLTAYIKGGATLPPCLCDSGEPSSTIKESQIVLEITEGFSGTNDMQLFRIVSALEVVRDLGVRIALDDFGTGGASLAIFSLFSFDYVKFSPAINVGNDRGLAILEAVTQLMNKLDGGSAIVIEGVETKEMMEVANNTGVFFGQGYFIGRPSKEPQLPDRLVSTAWASTDAPESSDEEERFVLSR